MTRPRLRVLICDDARLYSTMLSAQLEDDPEIEVVGVATTAPAGLDEAVRLAPDVVVLDHLLPDGDSSELVPRLRERVPAAAVVLVSGLPGEALARTAAGVGAQAWASKGASRDEVRAAILRAAAASEQVRPSG